MTVLAGSVAFALVLPARSQPTLTSQLGAVNAAVTEQNAREAAQQAAAQAELQREQEAQARERDREERAAEAEQRRRDAIAAADHSAAQARLKAAATARAARQSKDEAYADQMRDIDLQQRSLQLQAQQTRVNRENDVINAELARDKARTDVIQSKADSNRNVSEGAKSLMQDTGTAKVKDASRWFK
ncbi:DUF5384 family protein [Paraburkholderia sp. MM5482-R1]|uniref:DUF5384 family protein n=1 Tax=unclassified Paraburkholderia TaxID=2615204 RepID=UPI003D218DA0